MSVTSWNVNRSPARPPGVSRCVALRPISSSPRPSRGAIAELDARARRLAPRSSSSDAVDRAAAAAARRRSGGPTAGRERHAGDRLGGAVERQDALRRVGRRQAARQAVDDVLVERLQVGDLGRRLLEPRAGRPQAVGERAAEQRDGEEPEHVQRDRVLRDRPRRQRRRVCASATDRAGSPARARYCASTRPT